MPVSHPELASATHVMKVVGDAVDELAYQEKKWGHEQDDRLNTPWHWAAYIAGYATKWMAGTWSPIGKDATDAFRAGMIKVAALAIAAAASVDRQREVAGKASFE